MQSYLFPKNGLYLFQAGILLLLCSLPTGLFAQMPVGQDTLYGNEWINPSQQYFKIPVSEDGVYRIGKDELVAAGLPLEAIAASEWQLWHRGEQLPLYVSAAGVLEEEDYLAFWGQKNKGEMDRLLYADPLSQLNPGYSLITDTAAYFLSWGSGTTLRFEHEPNDLSNPGTPEPWFWYEINQAFTNVFITNGNSRGVTESTFQYGEGYATPYFVEYSRSIAASRPALNAGVDATISMRLVSSNGITHELTTIMNDVVQDTENFSGVSMRDYSYPIAAEALTGIQEIGYTGGSAPNDRYALASTSLRYPHLFHFNNQASFHFQLENSAAKYLEILGFNTTGDQVTLYDLTHHQRIVPLVENGVVKVKLPDMGDAARNLVMVNETNGWKSASLAAVDLSPLTEGAFVLITDQRLRNGSTDWVQAYADYRSSAAGRGFSTLIVDVQQLYDLFGYGVNRHPQAFRNFAHFAKKHWSDFQYVLLVGKGREFKAVRSAGALEQEANATFYVPTFGQPGSDNLLVASNTTNRPVVPIGRIAAETPKELEEYLGKVQTFETPAQSEADRAWRKQVMHLGGGGDPEEQERLKNAMLTWEDIIVNNEFGGEVSSFFKNSSDPIQQSSSETILNRINAGLGLISFYGHSGTGGFDFSIDDPSNWSNQDRYPVMLAMGCLSGQLHGNFRSISERFVLQKDRGSIAFLAAVSLAYPGAMDQYTKRFYERLGGADYGKSIGHIHQVVAGEFNGIGGLSMQSFLQQATIHGDPSLIITPFAEPDYLIETASPRVAPQNPTAQQANLTLEFEIVNLGRAQNDSIDVSIQRRFPDGVEVEIIRRRVATQGLRTPQSYVIPVNGERAIGQNRFLIELDPDNKITEGPLPIAETNNRYRDESSVEGVAFYVFPNGATPVYPPDFSIVSAPDFHLQVSTADVFSANSRYVLELDTTQTFDSPWKMQEQITQPGGVLRWQPVVNWETDQVYYWRVSLDSTEQQSFHWSNSSFVYRAGDDPGWNQSHFQQLTANELVNKELSAQTRKLKYLDDVKSIRVKNGIYPDVWPDFSINNTPHVYIPYTLPLQDGIYVAVFDSLTGDPWWNNPGGDYGSLLPDWAQVPFYPYRTTTPEDRSAAIDFLENTIPDGQYVLIYTVQWTTTSYEPENWAIDSLSTGTNLFQVLEAQGLNTLRQTATTGAMPYIAFYRKGDPAYPAYEELAVSAGQVLEQDFPITGVWSEGAVESVDVGPATSWDRCVWQVSEVEPLDEWSVEVYGIRTDSSVALLTTVTSGDNLDLSSYAATEYPSMRLRFNSMDTLNRTSPQLDYWRVYYTGLPDAAISAADLFDLPGDTVAQGAPLALQFAIANTSDIAMDSVEVVYQLGMGPLAETVATQEITSLAAQDTVTASISIDTRSVSGPQQLSITVNPTRDPAERYYPNNFGRLDFFVEKDLRNPLLDVTFDGRHIINGALVSAEPVIVVQLQDDNEFLRLSDTSLIQILLKAPNATDVSPIALSGSEVQFFPAGTTGANRAMIEYRPRFEEEGTYTLFVQGQDQSGNASGQFDYKIDFEILFEEKVSNVFNYPNPFTTQTQFVYTLTGATAPTEYRISIYTVSGRLVRTLSELDLGPLRIGTHRTDGYWDGTDDYGQRLANGVYLYRVEIRQEDGTAYDHLDTGTDQFFYGEMGKMVLLR